MKNVPPVYDKDGVHILDPADKLGYKTNYITKLQNIALGNIMPDAFGGKKAIDLGCGWGRLTQLLASKYWDVTGIDPDEKQIDYAKNSYPHIKFEVGGLPDLPIEPNSQDLILLNNVLRTLLLLNSESTASTIHRYLTENGMLIVVENSKKNSNEHFNSNQLINFFTCQGLMFERKRNFRASRNPLLIPIKYGLIPQPLFNIIAKLEVSLLNGIATDPVLQYYNTAYIFRKPEVND